MKWRNVGQLRAAVMAGLSEFRSADADCVVGVPRSGLIPATFVASYLNLPLSAPQSFVNGQTWWKWRGVDHTREGIRRVLVIDDSLNTGGSLNEAARMVESVGVEAVRAAVYGRTDSVQTGAADIVLQAIDGDRLFEWNLWKHSILGKTIFDMDGVLCRDPRPEENDDGPLYQKFIAGAEPLFIPCRPILAVCTSRLEKYRSETLAWLERNGVRFGALIMSQHETKEARVKARDHADMKAAFYSRSKAALFVESNRGQAAKIARIAGRPVVSVEGMELL